VNRSFQPTCLERLKWLQ